MPDAKSHLRALDRIEPPDVWERAVASRESIKEQPHDEIVTASPRKRATTAIVAFAVFGAAAFFAIRAFDTASNSSDDAPQGWAPGGARGVWQALPESPLSPRHGALAFWVDGRVVLIGGMDSEPCPPTADCGGFGPARRDGAAFVPSTGTWTTIAESPNPLSGATGTVLGDTIYLWVDQEPAGTSFLSYNVNQDSWESLPLPAGVDLPGYRLLTATSDALIAYPDSQERGAFPDLLYDPSTRTWRELPPDPLVPSFDRSMVWTGDEVLLFAIEDARQPEGSFYLYRAAALDIASGTWRRLPDSGIAGYSPTWFWSAGRAVNPTIGRVGDEDEMGAGHPYGGMLDPTTGSWSDLPRPPNDLREYGGPSVGESGHVVSWQGAILDVAAGTWSALPPLPVAADEGAAVVWAGDRLVVWGGFDWEDPDPRNPEGALLNTGWWWKP
jgi:hypothetical protein